MLDSDLARLYGVPTKVFNRAVKRNLDRFPENFMFQLAWKEAQQVSRTQIVTLKRGQNPKYRPYAFTEHGVAEILATHKELALKLQELERQQQEQGAEIAAIYNLVKRLLIHPKSQRRPIGFIAREK